MPLGSADTDMSTDSQHRRPRDLDKLQFAVQLRQGDKTMTADIPTVCLEVRITKDLHAQLERAICL